MDRVGQPRPGDMHARPDLLQALPVRGDRFPPAKKPALRQRQQVVVLRLCALHIVEASQLDGPSRLAAQSAGECPASVGALSGLHRGRHRPQAQGEGQAVGCFRVHAQHGCRAPSPGRFAGVPPGERWQAVAQQGSAVNVNSESLSIPVDP